MATEKKAEEKKQKRPTAQKRDLQNAKRRLRNRMMKSKIKTTLRSFEEVLSKKDQAETQEKLSSAYSVLDKAVKKGVIKLNKASRTKARLHAKAAK